MLQGCVTKQFVQAFDGEALPDAHIALLRPYSGLHVLSIDGDTTKSCKTTDTHGAVECLFALKPGKHIALVRYYSGTHASTNDLSVEFDVARGKRYLMKSNRAAIFPTDWHPTVVELTDERCWSQKAGTIWLAGTCD